MFVPNCRPIFLLVVMSIVEIGLCQLASAQSFPIGGTLYGEPVVSSSTPEDGISNFVATANTVYVETAGYYEQFYTPPGGKKVRHIAWKKLPGSSYKVLLIQLDDGAVVYIRFKPFNAFLFTVYEPDSVAEGTVQSIQFSEGWVKLVGDALYSLSSSYVYVDRDNTLDNWEVDSTGPGNAHVWDIAIDTSQHVYAATGLGLFVQNPDSNV